MYRVIVVGGFALAGSATAGCGGTVEADPDSAGDSPRDVGLDSSFDSGVDTSHSMPCEYGCRHVDTGVIDSGELDTEGVDTGSSDTGLLDTRVLDTGVIDTLGDSLPCEYGCLHRDSGPFDSGPPDGDASDADASLPESGDGDSDADGG